MGLIPECMLLFPAIVTGLIPECIVLIPASVTVIPSAYDSVNTYVQKRMTSGLLFLFKIDNWRFVFVKSV